MRKYNHRLRRRRKFSYFVAVLFDVTNIHVLFGTRTLSARSLYFLWNFKPQTGIKALRDTQPLCYRCKTIFILSLKLLLCSPLRQVRSKWSIFYRPLKRPVIKNALSNYFQMAYYLQNSLFLLPIYQTFSDDDHWRWEREITATYTWSAPFLFCH